MKTLILTFALAAAMSGATAFAQDYRHHDDRASYSHDRRDSLERPINHLNRMLEHVRWQVRHDRADWRIRREIQNISREADRVNYRYRHGQYNGWRLRRDVDQLHDRLHAVEQQ